jgi:hypothetical protein
VRIRAGADQQRKVGHFRDRDAIEHDAFPIDQRQLALALPQGRGRTLDDIDYQRIRQAPRHSRVLHPSELQKLTPNRADVDKRLRRLRRAGFVRRPMQLVVHHLVDELAIHVVDADDLVAADGEASSPNRGTGRALGLRGNVERDDNHQADRKEESAKGQSGELVGARLVDGQAFRDLLRHRDLGRSLARLCPSASTTPDMRLAHPSASWISRSTSSP